jgi:hypothetical protein
MLAVKKLLNLDMGKWSFEKEIVLACACVAALEVIS